VTGLRQDESPALARRLRAAAAVLLDPPLVDTGELWTDAAVLIDRLVRTVRADAAPARLWLLYSAIATAYPTPEQLIRTWRRMQLCDTADEATVLLLDTCLTAAVESGWAERDVEIVSGEVLVDVHFTATNSLHTGIQRVVRSAMPHWRDQVRLVGWTPNAGTLRDLRPDERAMVLEWTGREATGSDQPAETAAESMPLLIPWHSVLVLAEVPARAVSERLAALAQHSGNAVTAIGYDCIPIVSADLVPPIETEKFVHYLGIIKHVRTVAGISGSAAAEFRGFARMLATQGLPGPTVTECLLPAPIPARRLDPVASAAAPTILCVGSFEPRKNQLALLYAAEALWRQGHRFGLQFVGGSAWGREFPRVVRRLKHAGRDITVRSSIGEQELLDAYATARFTVFTSVHEGYGLPVAESLAAGTPVITSDFGSLQEIGAAGGAVLIDPRDDDALVRAMRELLVDDARIAQLRREIAARPSRSWADYARELWNVVVAPAGPAPELVTAVAG
jgi:glycosyltransferase involved in cell wall biosynthesis